MKHIQHKLIALVFIFLAFSHPGSSQDKLTSELRFEVNRVHPYISITNQELNEATNLADLNRRFESSWIREYISVEILTSHNGKIMKSASKSDILSEEQKDLMNMADAATDISIKIKYIPENTLTYNDPNELNFTITVDPDSEAEYPGGQEQLRKYLKENAIDKIPITSFQNYDLSAINFTISEEGKIIDAHVFDAAYQTNEKIDDLLVETIRNMPSWKPAEYADGTKVKQEFVFTVGNMESCLIPLLNIREVE